MTWVFSVESDVFDTLAILNGGRTVGCRTAQTTASDPDPASRAPRATEVLDERFLSTRYRPMCCPARLGVVGVGDDPCG
jgi:hypothetical protein